MKKYLYLIVLLVFISCEEETVPIPELEIPTSDRVVLLEDLTGVKCPNCPNAGIEIERLLGIFGDNLTAIAIHGSQLTSPLEESKYDFRNDFARDLEDYHSPNWGKPSILIDRVHFDGEEYIASISDSQWESYIVEELGKPVLVNLSIDVQYDPNTRKLNLETFILPTEDLQGNYKISVFLTESKIEDAQEWPTYIDEEYEHNHVLKHMLTEFNGDALATQLEKGVELKRTYEYTLPVTSDGLWIDDNIEVVVAIANEEGEAKTILQAAKSYLK